jgi:hypothetical protein
MSHGVTQTAPLDSHGVDSTASPGLLRVAGYGAIAAIFTLAVAGIALALFFGGAGDIYGPINDLFTAATLVLIIPAIIAIRGLAAGRVGGWLSVVSLAAIGGLLLAAVGFVLLVVGAIDLQASFVTFGLGMLPFLAWIAGLAVLSLRDGIIRRSVGWWIVAFALAIAASIGGAFVLSMEVLSLTLAPLLLVSLAGVLVSLGRDLLARA